MVESQRGYRGAKEGSQRNHRGASCLEGLLSELCEGSTSAHLGGEQGDAALPSVGAVVGWRGGGGVWMRWWVAVRGCERRQGPRVTRPGGPAHLPGGQGAGVGGCERGEMVRYVQTGGQGEGLADVGGMGGERARPDRRAHLPGGQVPHARLCDVLQTHLRQQPHRQQLRWLVPRVAGVAGLGPERGRERSEGEG